MIPATCNAKSVARLDKAVTKLSDLSNNTRRALLVANQEDKGGLMSKDKIAVN
ncbi:MAG: hypothetical protein ACI88A_004271 [Paraglaciecola sp.]|jgi:hypothetical protein